ncbi:MAG: glycosyltransferase family 39 protein [Thermomicrobiales bacterium]
MTMTAPHAPAHRRHAKRRPATALDRTIARGLTALERPEAPYLVLLAAFTVTGLYLRLDQLGGQSLWFDEADVVMQARESLGALLRNFVTAGQNGPLFTLFLHFWTALFGVSEAVVRLPSALAGAAAIPLVYALGRALHGPKLGLYAAGILTVAPYQHWYAQDAKMYALVVALALTSTLLLVLADGADWRGYWIGYAVVTTLALYVHVTVALLLAAQLAWFALGQWRGVRTHPGRRGWIAFAALTLPYLPVALWELRFVRGNAVTWHRPIGLRAFLDDTLTKFATGVRADPGTQLRGLILFLALALLGLLPLAWRHAPWPAPALSPRRRALLLGALFLLPLALF